MGWPRMHWGILESRKEGGMREEGRGAKCRKMLEDSGAGRETMEGKGKRQEVGGQGRRGRRRGGEE